MKRSIKRTVAIVAAVVVITNMILLALNKINSLAFWGILILGAIVAYLLGRIE